MEKKIKEVNNTQKNETVLKLQILHMEWAFKIYFSTFWTPIICIVKYSIKHLDTTVWYNGQGLNIWLHLYCNEYSCTVMSTPVLQNASNTI